MKHEKSAPQPKPLIERRLAEAMDDLRQGRVYGPFKSAHEMKTSLRRNANHAQRLEGT